jgi:iron complex outermembrane receptor protein
MTRQSGRCNRALPAALIYALSGAAAQAQEAPVITEVVVTAQRATTLASKTPVALSVLDGEALRRAGIDSPAAIGARLPNVHLDGAADGLRITIRGVSNNDSTEKGDPSAAFMLDGIYIARPQSMNQVLFDLARVEVLRGPQGTLYGRNATAGVVNVIANTPDKQREGAFGVGVGSDNRREADAMLNLPVSDALQLRAAFSARRHDNLLRNVPERPGDQGPGRDERAARLSAKLALAPNATLLLRYQYALDRNNKDSIVPYTNFYRRSGSGQPQWTSPAADDALRNSFVPPNAPLQPTSNRAASAGVGAQLDWQFDGFSLHYLGAQRRFDHDYKVNYYYLLPSGMEIGVRSVLDGRYEQDSHELRIATAGARTLTAQAGLYYFREESDLDAGFRDLESQGLPPYYQFHTGPTIALGKALFAQATWHVNAQLRLTAGARYSTDDKSRQGSTRLQQQATFNPATDLALPNVASLSTHKTTWRLGIERDLGPRTLLFATVSTGYKAGGFNDGCRAGSSADGVACPDVLAVPEAALVYQPETLTAWEAGLKTRFWQQRASLNATAFYYDYANLQLSGVVITSNVPRFTTTNAAQARVRGLEIEGEIKPSAAGRISYSLALLNAEYSRYRPDGVTSWDGKKLDRSPGSSVTLGYEHRFRLADGMLTGGVFSRTSGAYVISVPGQLLQYPVPRRTETELSADYQPQGAPWSVRAHLRNLENKVAPVAIDSFGMVQPGEPRSFGVRLDLHF